jgi:hypothetical protein
MKQIHKAIVYNGATQFTIEQNLLFHGKSTLQVTKIKYKKKTLSVFAEKQLVCRFHNCPVYVEYV